MALRSIWPNWEEERLFATLLSAILFVLFLGGIALTIAVLTQIHFIGRTPRPIKTVAVTGQGKIFASPNTATVNVSADSQKPTEAAAVAEVTTKMNSLIIKLKGLGISEDDLQTQQYSVYPRYDYPNGRQVASGYQATQQLTVKVRDQKLLPTVLQTSTDLGANVGGVNYSFEETEPLKAQARLKAITSARSKAQGLAEAIGVHLGSIVSFDESSPDQPGPIPYAAKDVGGLGEGSVTPQVPSGQQEIDSTVTLTYEIY